ncbi:MAG: hypothetical protein V3R57_04770, partial [Candidatus Bathyarchaeia archaeon]
MLEVESKESGNTLEILGQQKGYLPSDLLNVSMGEVGSLDNRTLTSLQISSGKQLRELQRGLDELIQRIGRTVARLRATNTSVEAKDLKNKPLARSRT